jgi:uncharacterized protein (UPF0147 family)
MQSKNWEKVDWVKDVVETQKNCKYTTWLDTDATITNTPTYIRTCLWPCISQVKKAKVPSQGF